MKAAMPLIRRWGVAAALAVVLPWLSGCDEDEYDHDPPAGQGTLVVDNFTGDRVEVYIDGMEVESVRSGKHRYYDLAPGVHRIALDGDDTRRFWADDIDILEGRLTVLEVRGYSGSSYDVWIYFD